MRRARKSNPGYPTRMELLNHARAMHTHMRKFVGGLEAFGRDVVPPLSEKDVHEIADIMSEMTGDSRFVKKYFHI